MNFKFAIIFLLSCSYGRGTSGLAEDAIADQIATASQPVVHIASEKPQTSETSSTSLKFTNASSSQQVHYENSNGFVPMSSPYQVYPEGWSNNNNRSATSPIELKINNNDQSSVANRAINSSSDDKMKNDLIHGVEARMLINLGDNRRSYNEEPQQQKSSSEFELLKVKNDTPAVANYNEFYENVKSEVKKSSEKQQQQQQQQQPERSRSQVAKKLGGRLNRERHGRYNAYSAISDNNNQKKSGSGGGGSRAEEHQSNYHSQEGQANYGSTNTRQKPSVAASLPSASFDIRDRKYGGGGGGSSGKENNDNNSTSSPVITSRWRQRFAKPVIVAEPKPTDKKIIDVISINDPPPRQPAPVVEDTVSSTFNHSTFTNRGDHGDEYDDTAKDYTEEVHDYEYVDKSKSRKHKRRPYTSYESSKKLPKEHRGNGESYDSRKRYPFSKSKYNNNNNNNNNNNRPTKTSWGEEHPDIADAELEEPDHQQQQHNYTDSWSQLSPNMEMAHSSGFEVEQIEKPKIILPLNLLPLANFDHASALDSSQGFDLSNAGINNYISSTFSTGSPLSSTSSIISDKNQRNLEIITSPPDIIVGQSSFQNPVPAMLGYHNANGKFLSSTVGPILAVAPTFQALTSPTSASPTATTNLQNLQNLQSLQNLQNLQNVPINRLVAVPQLIVPQPTLQALLQSPATSNYQIQVNSHGLLGHNNHNVQQAEASTLQPSTTKAPVDTHGRKRSRQKSNFNYSGSRNNGKDEERILKMANEAVANTIQELQSQIQSNSRQSKSQNYKAHLPTVGANNVEIINPNLQQNPLDVAIVNPYGAYPAAVLTTPIPIFSTAALVTTSNPSQSTSKSAQAQGLFNPINFVPSGDLVKSQTILNNNVHLNENLSNNLKLVPLIPGGSFFNSNHDASHSLTNKPKLNSDLEKYAEEMFNESLKTMYNSHKWNHDRKLRGNHSLTDVLELLKLKDELQRFRASNPDFQKKDPLEGHYSEQVQLTEPRPFGAKQNPVSMLETLLKQHNLYEPSAPITGGGDYYEPSSSNDNKQVKQLTDYLTPPKPNSYVSKSPFHEKPVKSKSRPSGPSGHRPAKRPSSSSPEGSSSNRVVKHHYDSPVRYEKGGRPKFMSDFRPSSYDKYPSLTTSSPSHTGHSYEVFKGGPKKRQNMEFTVNDMNNQRVHNFFGLLMKNKKLPDRDRDRERERDRNTQHIYFRNNDDLSRYFDEETRRSQIDFLESTLRSFKDNSPDKQKRLPALEKRDSQPIKFRHQQVPGT